MTRLTLIRGGASDGGAGDPSTDDAATVHPIRPSRAAEDAGQAQDFEAWRAARPALLRACAGEPVLVGPRDVDLLGLVADATDLQDYLFDPIQEGAATHLAELVVIYLLEAHGLNRSGQGNTVDGALSHARRWLIPFATEVAHTMRTNETDPRAEALTRMKVRKLEDILAGESPVPAATTAGAILSRPATSCIWLTVTDAELVVAGGTEALAEAIDAGRQRRATSTAKPLKAGVFNGRPSLPVYEDARTGQTIVAAADLAAAKLLITSERPHGLDPAAASNVLRTLNNATSRAGAHDIHLKGDLALRAKDTLPKNRARDERPKEKYVSTWTVMRLCATLPPMLQVAVWILRLAGLRIGEVYGLRVSDYGRTDDGYPYLQVDKQGGASTLHRNKDDGDLVRTDEKARTKTSAGERKLRICESLGLLIERFIDVHHTDPRTGQVDTEARLLPGLDKDDTGGQSALRDRLAASAAFIGFPVHPHQLRAALGTDVQKADLPMRIRFAYLGHQRPNGDIQARHYDLGVTLEEHQAVIDVVDDRLLRQVLPNLIKQPTANEPDGRPGTADVDLMVATSAKSQFGRHTATFKKVDQIEERLRHIGWRTVCRDVLGTQVEAVELTVAEAAKAMGSSVSAVKRLIVNGSLPAHREAWGHREKWVILGPDLDTFMNQETVSTQELADELNIAYHSVRKLIADMELEPPGFIPGTRLRLDPAAAEQVRTEHARRVQHLNSAVAFSEAARILDIPATAVETLVRSGKLTQAPTPASGFRYITRKSVEDYQVRHPKSDPRAPLKTGDRLVPIAQARVILGVSRPVMSALTQSNQVELKPKPGTRHQYVTLSSMRRWAKDERVDGFEERLQEYLKANNAKR